jgi:hypothetical protein
MQPAHDGEAFLALYVAHRDGVRSELERAGLPAAMAEVRVGDVFERYVGAPRLGNAEGEDPGQVLAAIARTVAREAGAAVPSEPVRLR